ncbi:MAG: calcium/sodium antiporter [Firmicutes bacterium]|nr:calcium/sodium antiporter [Bacillota bacterium]
MDYILLITGFVLLVKGADFFVDGSSAIARFFKIPSIIIGLTIVAMGTSAPEAAVSITAALAGNNGIAVGNVLGSNIFNLLMVLGFASIIKACPVQKETIKDEFPLSIIAVVMFAAFALISVGNQPDLHFSRIEGIIFLALFAYFIINMVCKALANPATHNEEKVEKVNLPKSIVLSVIGLAGIIFGGDLVVDSASSIATSFGIDETLVGLTIVAIGTSLPEWVTSVTAAVKGETDIAIGNVIGSNLFNILFVLGLSVTIHPVSVEMNSVYDAAFDTLASILVMIPCLKNRHITRKWGIFYIILYAAYMVYIIMR